MLAVVVCASAGCSSSAPPESAAPPAHSQPDAAASPSAIYSGAADSVSRLPGSPASLYRYRFKQIDPASDRFTYQDRELSFYFRPTPGAIHFQVENRTDKPISIDWDATRFIDQYGRTAETAHQPTTWANRYSAQAPTLIPGLQRYSDYVFSKDLLVDPGGSDEQLHRPLFPEDLNAPQMSDAEFGVIFTFIIDGSPREYPFRFRVVSVLPR